MLSQSLNPFPLLRDNVKTRNVSETYMPPLMQNSKLLLICTRHGCNPCTKFGIDQVKGSKDIERTTHWARKSGLTLTFEHVTWKSIGIIYLLRATSAPSLILFKWRGQKILSGQHLVYRPTDIPTDSCKTICPLF